MSKFTCLFVCVVAASLYAVDAGFSEAEKTSIREAVSPIITECANKHGYTLDDIKAAQQSNNIGNINPCHFACVLKKTEIMNEQGQYNSRSALDHVLEKHVSNLSEYQDKAEKCSSVNTQSVSDGEAGCERAKLILACFKEQGLGIAL